MQSAAETSADVFLKNWMTIFITHQKFLLQITVGYISLK